MGKVLNRIGMCAFLAVFFLCGTLISDKQRLQQEMIRLHVVANSDTVEDQQYKLMVKDAVTSSLQMDLQNMMDVDQAKQYLQEKLPYIQSLAEDTLRTMGCTDGVTVSLCREAFDKRVYDTFSLPAGVYNALRIVIGEGGGKNWWCVVFPAFCVQTVSGSFETAAAGAGFPETLSGTLTEETGYELRFAVLDAMGKLENILFQG